MIRAKRLAFSSHNGQVIGSHWRDCRDHSDYAKQAATFIVYCCPSSQAAASYHHYYRFWPFNLMNWRAERLLVALGDCWRLSAAARERRGRPQSSTSTSGRVATTPAQCERPNWPAWPLQTRSSTGGRPFSLSRLHLVLFIIYKLSAFCCQSTSSSSSFASHKDKQNSWLVSKVLRATLKVGAAHEY